LTKALLIACLLSLLLEQEKLHMGRPTRAAISRGKVASGFDCIIARSDPASSVRDNGPQKSLDIIVVICHDN